MNFIFELQDKFTQREVTEFKGAQKVQQVIHEDNLKVTGDFAQRERHEIVNVERVTPKIPKDNLHVSQDTFVKREQHQVVQTVERAVIKKHEDNLKIEKVPLDVPDRKEFTPVQDRPTRVIHEDNLKLTGEFAQREHQQVMSVERVTPRIPKDNLQVSQDSFSKREVKEVNQVDRATRVVHEDNLKMTGKFEGRRQQVVQQTVQRATRVHHADNLIVGEGSIDFGVKSRAVQNKIAQEIKMAQSKHETKVKQETKIIQKGTKENCIVHGHGHHVDQRHTTKVLSEINSETINRSTEASKLVKSSSQTVVKQSLTNGDSKHVKTIVHDGACPIHKPGKKIVQTTHQKTQHGTMNQTTEKVEQTSTVVKSSSSTHVAKSQMTSEQTSHQHISQQQHASQQHLQQNSAHRQMIQSSDHSSQQSQSINNQTASSKMISSSSAESKNHQSINYGTSSQAIGSSSTESKNHQSSNYGTTSQVIGGHSEAAHRALMRGTSNSSASSLQDLTQKRERSNTFTKEQISQMTFHPMETNGTSQRLRTRQNSSSINFGGYSIAESSSTHQNSSSQKTIINNSAAGIKKESLSSQASAEIHNSILTRKGPTTHIESHHPVANMSSTAASQRKSLSNLHDSHLTSSVGERNSLSTQHRLGKQSTIKDNFMHESRSTVQKQSSVKLIESSDCKMHTSSAVHSRGGPSKGNMSSISFTDYGHSNTGSGTRRTVVQRQTKH